MKKKNGRERKKSTSMVDTQFLKYQKLTIFSDSANFNHILQIRSIVVELDTVIDGNAKFIVFGDLRCPCYSVYIHFHAINFFDTLKMEIITINNCFQRYVDIWMQGTAFDFDVW